MRGRRCDLRFTARAPTIKDIRRVWRADDAIHDASAVVYFMWIRRFRSYCEERGLEERAELTQRGVHRFALWYARRRGLDWRSLGAQSALLALARVYHVIGLAPPPWQSTQHVRRPASNLLAEYVRHLTDHKGNPERTINKKLDHVAKLQGHLKLGGKSWRSMKLVDLDAFLVDCADRYARTTVADIASTVRCFTRFLFSTGRISTDLALAVVAPVQPRHERPRRALPWDDVRRLLRAAKTAQCSGRRDYALLLMMSAYGLGAGEIISLKLDDIDWCAGKLNFTRPKTGVAFSLPLLPAIAQALSNYLRDERPPGAPTRHVFVQLRNPFPPFDGSSAVRHIIVKHANEAGLDSSFLGSHVLRHSNAARQIDLGTRPQVLSDLLGHRDPESISAYVRIATQSLRDVSLPVPL